MAIVDRGRWVTFDDQEWRRLSDALGVELPEELRPWLETIAHFRAGEDYRAAVAYYAPKGLAVAKAGREFIRALSDAKLGAWFAHHALFGFEDADVSGADSEIADALHWEQFSKRVDAVCSRLSHVFEKQRKRPNVDLDRDVAWTKLAQIYELVVGRAAKVTVDPDTGAVGGRFVEFTKAFMDVLHQKVPTGHQVRAFLRKRAANGESKRKSRL